MRWHTVRLAALLGSLLVVFLAAEARAQSNRQQQAQSTVSIGSAFGYNSEMRRIRASTSIRRAPSIASVSRSGRGGMSGRALRRGQRGASKPFANVQRQPTLSPYLNLLRNDGDDLGGMPNYHTFVRPVLEQQRTNRRTSRQLQGLNQEVQAVNRQLAHQPSQTTMLRPTGHETVFMNFSHYYQFGR